MSPEASNPRCDMEVLEGATEIVRKLRKAGFTAYFAGGWVRDHLLRHPSSDVDIATDAPPPVILDLFPQTILVGLAFGVVIVLQNGVQYEVATFRKDIGYTNGRKPEQIELSTPQEDAKRRDFTINGMFYDPLDHTIYDFVGGAEDLKRGIIRTIGNPDERFVEDRLRMIRAVRFACRFDFAIDPLTQQGIIENANTLFPAVAMERVWQELTKMSSQAHFDRALIEMHRLELLPEIFPSLRSIHLHTIKHQVSAFEHFPSGAPTLLYLLVLIPQATLPELIDIFQKLRVSNKEMALARLAFQCRQLIEKKEKAHPVEWIHFCANPDAAVIFKAYAAMLPHFERMLLLEEYQERADLYRPHIERAIQKTPLITADSLKAQGIPEGKLLGALLKEAEKIAVECDLHAPKSILEKLMASSLWPNNL